MHLSKTCSFKVTDQSDTRQSFDIGQLGYILLSVSVCYVAVRTIVLSRHWGYRTTLWFFCRLAGWKLRLRPFRFFYVQLLVSSSVRRAN